MSEFFNELWRKQQRTARLAQPQSATTRLRQFETEIRELLEPRPAAQTDYEALGKMLIEALAQALQAAPGATAPPRPAPAAPPAPVPLAAEQPPPVPPAAKAPFVPPSYVFHIRRPDGSMSRIEAAPVGGGDDYAFVITRGDGTITHVRATRK